MRSYLTGSDIISDFDQDTEEENSSSNEVNNQKPLNKWILMEQYCSKSIQDKEMTLIEKIWLIIARTDGESGQLLGQTISRGYEEIRAWVVSYIIWGAFSIPSLTIPPNSNNLCLSELPSDTCLPKSRSNVQKTISELKYIVEQHHQNQINSSSSTSSSSSLVSDDLELNKYNELHDNILFILYSFEIFLLIKNEVKNQNYQNLYFKINSTNNLTTENNLQKKIGQLISVHCGHNGWAHKDEISKLSECLSKIDWEEESNNNNINNENRKEKDLVGERILE